MGLDTSHGAFHGAYSAFNRFRRVVAKAWGGSFPPHEDPTLDPTLFYVPDGVDVEDHPGLYAFLAHSDCDGELSPEACTQVADALEALLPRIAALDTDAGGHIARDGGYVAVTQRFIAGCRRAAAAGEALDFH